MSASAVDSAASFRPSDFVARRGVVAGFSSFSSSPFDDGPRVLVLLPERDLDLSVLSLDLDLDHELLRVIFSDSSAT